MKNLYEVILLIHVLSGVLGLCTGTINIIKPKGGKRHRLVGNLFVFFMISTGISSVVIALLKDNTFLFAVGVFTVYLVGTGNRYMNLRLLGKGQKPKIIDWILSICMLIGGVYFISKGIFLLYNASNFGIALIVFGLVGLYGVKNDFLNYLGKWKNKRFWMLIHISRMTGGYIAALTAFIVVNKSGLPGNLPEYIYWLIPTFILTPLIIYWSKPYKQ
ncbi:hypothetical protein OAR37_04425 [Flavobacteriaceae bacterium]|uniref:DUF2306 domain-containing protein n=1 Tax=Candidatus Arcticimaribacter forsetii TaxID=2820661 RepID=UPI00207795FF|nr:DUF2306 domain-containing protein [Candidatus Arcticimaribacter forsetii]MDB4675126.1 hypothetical protein [Flavobacteriaceae bacterium]MDB4717115.1 hypothetical protein [Flavobacteriaceae bacterium]MDB4751701.1 hypothetical protein [Flavobacteriaceae bacterium]MDC0960662.1 hypothetical protein [Flavobacteriaceae bacterium]